jgi:hypothetical protein
VITAYFVDSSAPVKRYVHEVGTAWVRGITRHSSSTTIYIASITATNKPDEVKKRQSERAEIPRLSGSTCREITPQVLYDSGRR